MDQPAGGREREREKERERERERERAKYNTTRRTTHGSNCYYILPM